MPNRIQFRRDTAARWAQYNPVLMQGELGIETDTKLRKVGDGITAWNNLEYLAAENITQELGNSENAVMSQNAIGKFIDKRICYCTGYAEIDGYSITFKGNSVGLAHFILIYPLNLKSGGTARYRVKPGTYTFDPNPAEDNSLKVLVIDRSILQTEQTPIIKDLGDCTENDFVIAAADYSGICYTVTSIIKQKEYEDFKVEAEQNIAKAEQNIAKAEQNIDELFRNIRRRIFITGNVEVDGYSIKFSGNIGVTLVYPFENIDDMNHRYRIQQGTYTFDPNPAEDNSLKVLVIDSTLSQSVAQTPTVKDFNDYEENDLIIAVADYSGICYVAGQVIKQKEYEDEGKPASIGMNYFTVTVNAGFSNNDNTEEVQTDENYVEDYCAVRIPSNYRAKGEPHRLIIYNHGAGGSVSTNTATGIEETNNTFQLLSSLGYVLMALSAYPISLWESWEHSQKGCSMAGPISIKCIEQAYKYAIEKYNIRTDGIFVIGTSMGGLLTNNMVNNTSIPILAVALDAPVIDLYLDAWNSPWYGNAQSCGVIAKMYNFDNFRVNQSIPQFSLNGSTWINFSSATRMELNQYFYQNLEKVKGYNPPYNKRFYYDPNGAEVSTPTTPSESDAGVIDGTTIFDYTKYGLNYRTPIKIWHGENDSTNQYRFSEAFVTMIRNSGGNAGIRKVPTSIHGVKNLIPTSGGVSSHGTTVSPYGYEIALFFADHGGYSVEE